MKFRKPHLWIALCATGLVLLAAVVEVRRTAPGPLSAVHEQVPELAGMNDCSACHGGLFSSMGEACLSCHEPIAQQLDRGTGLHGDVGQAVGSQCARCHSEHHGPRFELISRQSFALAGVPDPEAFDHGLVGFDMRGRHLEVDCIGCHAHARDVVLPAGERRFLGLDQDCASCHEDAHEGRMVLDCRSCHGQEAWDQLEPWGHGRVLPLVGGHGDLACAECHDAEGPTSLEALGEGFGVAAAAAPGATAKVLVPADESDDPVAQAMSRRPRGREPRDCTACHESPHMPTLVMRVVADEIDRPGGQCAVCHEAEHTGFREAVVEMVPEHHAATGFQLVPPHDRAACADCHLADAPNFERRHPGRSADDCASCHADPHHGQFDRGPFAAEGCLACHDRRHFEPPAFGAEQHGRVDFPLDGSHLELECAACHGEPLHDGPRPFRGTPAKCEECHEDAQVGASAGRRPVPPHDELRRGARRALRARRLDGLPAGGRPRPGGLRGLPPAAPRARRDGAPLRPRR